MLANMLQCKCCVTTIMTCVTQVDELLAARLVDANRREKISTDNSSLAVFVTTWMESNLTASRIGCEIPSKCRRSPADSPVLVMLLQCIPV